MEMRLLFRVFHMVAGSVVHLPHPVGRCLITGQPLQAGLPHLVLVQQQLAVTEPAENVIVVTVKTWITIQPFLRDSFNSSTINVALHKKSLVSNKRWRIMGA